MVMGVIGQVPYHGKTNVINDPTKMNKSRDIYFLLYVLFGLAALGVGLASRILMPEVANMDTELTLPLLASKYLPDVLVGFYFSGNFFLQLFLQLTHKLFLVQQVSPRIYFLNIKIYWASKFATRYSSYGNIFAIFSKQNVLI